MSTAVAAGKWIDLGSHFSNGQPKPTFSSRKQWDKYSWEKHATRPDYIFANAAALSIIDNFQIRRDLQPQGHLGLEINVRTEWINTTYRSLKHPQGFPTNSSLPEDQKYMIATEILNKWKNEFNQSKNDPDKAWHVFAQISEEYLRAIHVDSKLVGEGGRHSSIKFQQMNTTQSAASKQHPVDSGTFALTKAFKVQRQSHELRFKLQKVSQSEQVIRDIQILEKCLIKFASHLGMVFPKDKQVTSQDLDCFESLLDQHITQLRNSQVKKRLKTWKDSLRFDFKKGGRKAFAWLKDEWKPPLNAITTEFGEISVTPQAVVDSLQTEWDRLFNQADQPSWEAFRNQFQDLLVSQPCIIEDITAEQIYQHIQRMPASRAIAVDGWRVSEMKQLPVSLLKLVAELYQAVENGQSWPYLNSHACISCLPKSTPDVTKFNPSVILAPSAYDTRPISNISPRTTIYSGLRFKQMSEWRDSWLPASMHGARRKHETSDVSFELQLLLEHSRVTKNHLAGITLDRRKFFDLLPHETCFNVLAALGAPQKVIVAERAFYKQFTCFYKANGAISSEVSQRTNGFVQGCSFSLQAALGLLSIWTKHVESTPVLQDTTISTGGFLDDNNMRCVAKTAEAAVQGLEKAWQRSLQFDALSGIQVNNSKTSCFGNTKPCRNFLQPAFCQNEPSLKLVNSFVLVGGMVTACGFTENDNREKRVQKASNRLKRGRYAPLAFSQRVHMIQSAVMPMALFGCEI